MAKIVQKGADILRKTAEEIPLEDIQGTKIKKIMKEMKEAVDGNEYAVAIAAPQLGYSLRMFMVSKRVFAIEENDENNEPMDLFFINPKLTKQSRKKIETDEGCLSVDMWYGKTKRSEKVTLESYNEAGAKIVRGASGLLAQIFQHEVDHLDGILFTDHATDLVELTEGELPKPHHSI